MSNIFDIVNIPIAFILKLCYMVVQNYGLAIIMFAILTKLLLLPLSIKSEKGRIKMQAIQPKLNALQAKYKGNTKDPKYAEEMQRIYTEEGYSPMSGCLPTLIQFPVLLSLWNAIRNPLLYINELGQNTISKIAQVFYENNIFSEKVNTQIAQILEKGNEISTWSSTNQVIIANEIPAHMDLVQDLVPKGFEPINMEFFGLNLGATPEFGWNWTVLIPIVVCLTSFLTSFISMRRTKTNSSGGDEATQKSMNTMLYIMPLFSLWVGFSMSIGISIYWFMSNVLSLLQVVLLPMFIKPPKVEVKEKKEKKLNYNQIKKMQEDPTYQPLQEANKEEDEK